MPLFNRNRPIINQKRFARNLSDTPYRFDKDVSTSVVKFENAKPSETNWNIIYNKVISSSDDNIDVCKHPSVSSGRMIRFFIGEPENLDIPVGIGSGSGECKINPEQFLSDVGCVVSYLFGHVVAKRRNTYGFKTHQIEPTNEIPYSPPEGDIKPNDSDLLYQVMFVEQDILDDALLKVSSVNLIHRTGSTGVPVITNETLDIDTWYNGDFESYNIGNNVSSGYLEDKYFDWNVGDRYNWTHGSISFTADVSTDNISGNIYEYDSDEKVKLTENGMEIKSETTTDTIKLVAWKFFVYGIGTDNDPYKETKHDFDFETTDVDLVSDLHINYFNRRYDKAIYISRLKTFKSDDNINLSLNDRGNIVIAKS